VKENEYQDLLKKVKRKLNGCHVPSVAKETFIPDSSVRRIISGKITRPHQDRLKRLAKYFGIK
jgi:predicted transcriptional regulator